MNQQEKIAEFNRRLNIAINYPDILWKRLSTLHDRIISHHSYHNTFDSETKFKFEFACMANFWPLRDNVLFSLRLWTILAHGRPLSDYYV